jgi:hypothetical protein
MAANDEVTTTLLTSGAKALIARRMPVVPFIAGSSRPLTGSSKLWWNGEAVWMTYSNGGSDLTA